MFELLHVFMYLFVVFIIPQSGVTTYAYVDCHISSDCVCRQQFIPAGTCVLSRNRYSHVFARTRHGQLSLWYLAKQISQTRSTSLVRLLLQLFQGWILRLYANQNFILGLVKTCRTISTQESLFWPRRNLVKKHLLASPCLWIPLFWQMTLRHRVGGSWHVEGK